MYWVACSLDPVKMPRDHAMMLSLDCITILRSILGNNIFYVPSGWFLTDDFLRINGFQKALWLTALLSSCKLKAVTSFIETVHLIVCFPLSIASAIISIVQGGKTHGKTSSLQTHNKNTLITVITQSPEKNKNLIPQLQMLNNPTHYTRTQAEF